MEQEVSVAIVRPWNTSMPVTDQIRADFEKVLSERQPLPDDDVDAFADEPLPTPSDPNHLPYMTGLSQRCGIRRKMAKVTIIGALVFLLLTSNRTNSMAQSKYGAC
jgi:hypothetical protein